MFRFAETVRLKASLGLQTTPHWGSAIWKALSNNPVTDFARENFPRGCLSSCPPQDLHAPQKPQAP